MILQADPCLTFQGSPAPERWLTGDSVIGVKNSVIKRFDRSRWDPRAGRPAIWATKKWVRTHFDVILALGAV